jgi:hypothetical protein
MDKKVSNLADVATLTPPSLPVPSPETSPVSVLKSSDLRMIGDKLNNLFMQYVSDRRMAELRWLRNQRQYLGLYDPDIEKELAPNRSKAYPRVTRIKCVSVLSRLMNLMFQGNERNWTLEANPVPDLSPADVDQAIQDAQKEDQETGDPPAPLDLEYVLRAVKRAADKRAYNLMQVIDDQLAELGGDQTSDYVGLNRDVVRSGIIYGMGVLRGPFVRKVRRTEIGFDKMTQQPTVRRHDAYMPQFEFRSIWDFYPDMSAKTLDGMDGYFERIVMSRPQVRDLADRPGFYSDIIKKYLTDYPMGNYRAQPFETELRAMGVKINVNEMKTETMKYEVIVWHGPLSGEYLMMCGADVPEDKLADDLEAEVWMLAGNIIKADINPWRKIGKDVKTFHTFLFDEDDTSPVGQGLPNIMRDSQMSISAMTRMYLDNASVVCGPNLELNTDLLRLDQDLSSTAAYKIWYREGSGPDAQFPAVRNVQIDAHLDDLQKGIEMFLKFSDMETFVGPATGGDMAQAPSEPFRTAAGASMLRGDQALPFKDIVRSFDQFTMSVIESLVQFNKVFNNSNVEIEGDYNVIARGATSLIAKEVRGMQVDQLAMTLKPEEMDEIDMRKLVQARMSTRDLDDLMLPEDIANRNKEQKAQAAQAHQDLMDAVTKANERKLLADAFKNIAQGNKNSAVADATNVDQALKLLEQGINGGSQQQQQPDSAAGAPPGDTGAPAPGGGQLPAPSGPGIAAIPPGVA